MVKFIDNAIMRIMDVFERIWDNPTWNCKRCISLINSRGYTHLSMTQSGFNKYHWHKMRFTPVAKKCSSCDEYLSRYNFGDLEKFRVDNEDHYRVKSGAKTIEQQQKEKEMAATLAQPVGTGQIDQWYWHVHHQVLAEQLTAPIQDRINAIKAGKDAQETRLHFMRPVQNPPALALGASEESKKATQIYDAVKRAYNRGAATYEAFIAAGKRRDAALANAQGVTSAEWEALHKKECFHYCPWNTVQYGGQKTIIPAYTPQGQPIVGKK